MINVTLISISYTLYSSIRSYANMLDDDMLNEEHIQHALQLSIRYTSKFQTKHFMFGRLMPDNSIQ